MKKIRLFGTALLCVGLFTACSSNLVSPTPGEEEDDDTDNGNGETDTMIVEYAPEGIVV